MNNKKRNFLIMVLIIVLALVLVIFGKKDTRESDVLPTRDTEGIEAYASIEEFCTELTTSQEFDDSERASLFYQTCILEYSK